MTHFSERKVFRSSVHITLAGSRSRSIDEGSGSVEFHVDPNTKKLVTSALNKEKSPEFVIKPRRQFVNEGETAKFKATFDGSPSTELTWSLNGKPVIADDRHKISQDNEVHLLEILKAKPEDQGNYVCKIENSAGSSSADAELEVFVRPKPHSGKSSAFLPPTVDVPLEDTEFADKEKEATLVCKFHNGIDGHAKWYKDGREVGSWQGKASYDGRTARLVLREASKRVCGVYECIVRNSGGEAKTRALVSLLDPSVKPIPPKFTVSLCDQDIEKGEKLVLETEVTGKPRPSLKWYKDNQELGSSQDIRMEYKEGKGRLIVDNFDPTEGSNFTCVAQNVAGKDQTKSAISATDSEQLREPPIFTKELHDMEVNDGDRVELSVEVKGTPPIDIVWVHNNREIPPADPVCRMIREGDVHKLVVPEVFPEDAGEYVCEAYNDYGDTDTFCRLVVHEEKEEIPQTVPKSPEFIVHPQKLYVSTGTSAILKCQVDGEPPPSVQWSKGGQKLKHGPKYKITSAGEEHFLEITSTTREDSGQYTCILCNPSGNTSATTLVTVGETNHTSSPSAFRPVHRNRSQNLQSKLEHSTDSESSDISSVDSETNKTKKPEQVWSPTIGKKGGVSQVDFRGILKPKSSPARSSGDENPKINSIKTVGPQSSLHKTNLVKSIDSSRNGSTKFGSTLSQARQKFEGKSDSKPECVQNGGIGFKVINGTSASKSVGGKVNQMLQTFKNKETSPKATDFRSVLKPRKELETSRVPGSHSQTETRSIPKHNITSPTKTDYRSVLKPRKEVETSLVKGNNLKTDAKSVPRHTDENQTNFKTVKVERLKSTEELLKLTNTSNKMAQEAINDTKPEFKNGLGDQTVNYGSQVVMECEVTGNPEPDISWSVNNKEIKQSKYFQMSYDKTFARLTIAEVFSEDEGEYRCKAINTAGQSTNTCNLHIQASSTNSETTDTNEEPFSPTATPPKIYDISPAEFCILRGGSIEFKASYTSVPAGSVKWCKHKTEIISDDRRSVDTSEHFSTLLISNIQQRDSGRYNIIVENSLGSDISFATLTVQDVPECPVGHPWVSDVTLTSVTLSWYGPAYDGGCPVTNYRVEMCDAEDQEWILVTSNCVSTTYVINNLTPLTPYFFRIFAENKHGISTPCQTTEVTVTREKSSQMERQLSVESDDVFMHESSELLTPMSEYGIVSPLSPDEIPFEHREVELKKGRKFEDFYNCLQEVGKGKFGSVYKCEEKFTGKTWAAKILKCRETEKKKIYLEVEIMNKLKHPKILMLWDVFEGPRKMILVMEYIGGGELFERVLDDDFELTERDCIQFMRQILDAVHYMHSRNILHLDLKPENILCLKNESNKVKIIDFGLARFYNPGESVRVLFGTPEFIAPEVVNYDEIGFKTDMWSIGVVCYVLLTGLSPFMGDTDAETLANVTQGEFDFDDESFDNVSEDGKTFIENLLVKDKNKRLTSQMALDHKWLAQDAARMKNRKINTRNLKRFMARRKWQKTGNAIRALGRMTSLSKLLKNSSGLSSASNNGNGSLSACSSLSSSGSRDTITEVADIDVHSLKVSDSEMKSSNQNGVDAQRVSDTDGSSSTLKNSSCDTYDNQMDINANNKKSVDSAFVQNSSKVFTPISGGIDTGTKSSVVESVSVRLQHQDKKTDNTLQTNGKSDCVRFCKEMVDSKAFPGDAVRFDVEYNLDANIEVTWYFEEDEIHEGERHSIQLGNKCSSLIIKDVCEDDDGEYFCKIEKENNEEICSAELIVFGAL